MKNGRTENSVKIYDLRTCNQSIQKNIYTIYSKCIWICMNDSDGIAYKYFYVTWALQTLMVCCLAFMPTITIIKQQKRYGTSNQPKQKLPKNTVCLTHLFRRFFFRFVFTSRVLYYLIYSYVFFSVFELPTPWYTLNCSILCYFLCVLRCWHVRVIFSVIFQILIKHHVRC